MRDESRALVVLPTYNEAAHIVSVIERIRTTVPAADVLVVDDASPDGTGRLVDVVGQTDESVHVLHRAGKEGLGAAYRAGFGWGLRQGYDVLVQMDADGSHQPEQLPRLMEALDSADIVVGSRWVSGGRVVRWPRSRELLSRAANLYTQLALGLRVKDSTAGFRVWRRGTLEAIELDRVRSQGYCFQIDLTRRAAQHGYRVGEVAIEFVERAEGESKMNAAIVAEAFWRVTAWGARERITRLRQLLGRTGRV